MVSSSFLFCDSFLLFRGHSSKTLLLKVATRTASSLSSIRRWDGLVVSGFDTHPGPTRREWEPNSDLCFSWGKKTVFFSASKRTFKFTALFSEKIWEVFFVLDEGFWMDWVESCWFFLILVEKTWYVAPTSSSVVHPGTTLRCLASITCLSSVITTWPSLSTFASWRIHRTQTICWHPARTIGKIQWFPTASHMTSGQIIATSHDLTPKGS